MHAFGLGEETGRTWKRAHRVEMGFKPATLEVDATVLTPKPLCPLCTLLMITNVSLSPKFLTHFYKVYSI